MSFRTPPAHAKPCPVEPGVAFHGTANFPDRLRRSLLRVIGVALALPAPCLPVLARVGADQPAETQPAAAAHPRVRFGSGAVGIALFVPPMDGIYERAARALADGVRAAWVRDGAGISVEVVEVADDVTALRDRYDELQRRGFSLVIGPLTRDGVSIVAAAGAPPVFTLALNQTDDAAWPANMMAFGLSLEAEARQAASFACAQVIAAGERPRAAVVRSSSAFDARSAEAFAQRWRSCGGDVYEAIEVDVPGAGRLRDQLDGLGADVLFVAGDVTLARAARIALGPAVPLYGTSRLNSGAVLTAGAAEDEGAGAAPIRTPELDGVRLVDLPWRIQPDAAAVMTYIRSPDLNLELQKLYALGIDAFRVARLLIDRAPAIDLDGVTGHLHLSRDGTGIERDGILAEYREGILVPIDPS